MENSDANDMIYPSLKRDAYGNLTELILEPVNSDWSFSEDVSKPAETGKPPENIPTKRTGVSHLTL